MENMTRKERVEQIRGDFFFCYSKRMSSFLIDFCGIPYVTIAKDIKTKKVFTLFVKNDQLIEGLESYKKVCHAFSC